MRHFFLDTNVALDFLAQRQPFAAPATDLFQLADEEKVVLYVSSLSFSHVLYLLRKTAGPANARSLLLDLVETVTITAVGSATINDALRADFIDFEDAIQYFAARAVPAIEAIVTRDPKGFAAGTLPVLAPAEALRLLR